jgi:glycosyltransferase involved in cell wall biosynthesis
VTAAHPAILHVISHLDIGGAEEVAISLAEQLHADYDFCFFAVLGVADTPIGQRMKARLDAIGVPVVSGTRLDMKRGGAVQAAWRLARLIRQRRPALVHLHTEIPEATAALALLGGMPAGTQVVRTVHNSTLWPAWQRIGGWTERRLRRASVVGVSQASLDGLRAFQTGQGQVPTPTVQTRVIYNGVRIADDPECLVVQPASRPVRVIFAGRFEPAKGVDLIPGILSRAARLTDRPLEITVVGSGSLGPLLGRWAAAPDLRWPVRLAGPLPDLARQLRDYDLMLMPSRFEGLALVAIEAVMAGLPVVASRVPGLTEVFPADYPLFAVSEDQDSLAWALVQAATHLDDHRQQLTALRRELSQKFSLSGMAQRYAAFYHEVAQPPAISTAGARANG